MTLVTDENEELLRPMSATSMADPTTGMTDEELARALQEQEQLEYQNTIQRSSPGSNSNIIPVAPASMRAVEVNLDDDEDCARRYEQQLRDEELAAELQREEAERRPPPEEIMEPEQAARSSPRKCTTAKVIRLVFFVPLTLLAILAVCALGYEKYTGKDALSWIPGWVPGLGALGDVKDMFIPDSFNNDELYSWKTSKKDKGLRLEIVNALTDNWYPFFKEAVHDWGSGTPALNLTTSKQPHDSFCTPITGKMKVCNGYYGQTDWKGINELVYRNGYILSSIAKMNDQYMEYSTDEERQYLMCHEMGHGFGLPHTDENFYNADLGNCMDYTNNPGNNQRPDESNFALLLEMYGAMEDDSKNISDFDSKNATAKLGGKRRMRGSHQSDRYLSSLFGGKKWTVLDRGLGHESYESDLGDGYVKRIHILLS